MFQHRTFGQAWLRVSLAVLLAVLSLWPGLVVAETTVDDIARELICQCGCTMVVSTCDCGTASTTKTEIREKLDQGQSKDQILASYVARYGEKVLAAPTKRGFNLTAWVTPFVALSAGGGVLFLALRTWVLRPGERAAERAESLAGLSEEQLAEYEERLRQDLDQELE